MRAITRRAACLAVLPVTCCYPQLAPGPDVTSGFMNGRLWLKLDDNTKLSLLIGCRDAFLLGAMFVTPDLAKIPDQLKFPDLTTAEISKEMDLFFSEGANGPIPIIFAIRYVRHKAMGDTPEQLQSLMAVLRRSAK